MKHRTALIITGVILLGCVVGSVNGSFRPKAWAADLLKGQSSAVRSRITELDSPTLGRTQKTELALALLRDEVAHPTPNAAPGAADARNHDGVAAYLLEKLEGADPATLRSAREGTEGELHQLLSLALTQAGDAEGDKDTQEVLRDQKVYRLNVRLRAAQALAKRATEAEDNSEAAELGRLFGQVLVDEVQWRPLRGKDAKQAGGGEFPVRKVAVAAIRTLQDRGVKLDSYVLTAARQAVVAFGGPPAAAAK